MSNTPKIDEILAKVSRGERDWIHDQLDGTSMVQENLEAVDKEVAEAKDQLYQLILEVIGDDEYVNGMTGDDKLMTQHADYLRQEQRIRLTKLFNIEEK